MFAAFGGFLNLIRAVSNLSIGGIQGFSISNSMIKKLYTTNKKSADGETAEAEREENVDKRIMQSQGYDLIKTIRLRSVFSYKYYNFWLYDTFKAAYCCCCRRMARKDDLLF